MSDITLSKAVRSNLLNLQNTAELLGRTQERLATGKKVNSALDNPVNFFTASSLNARASDMGSLLDSMANGIQTLEAADNGLTAITKTLESMQSTLTQARQDKSFKTQSYVLPNAPGAGDTIGFLNGAFETAPADVNLTKGTGGTSEAGAFTAFTVDAATSGGLTAAGTFAQITFDAANDVLAFDIDVDGVQQTFDFDQAEVQAALGKTTVDDVDELATLINTKLTGATADNNGGDLRITSDATGTTSNVEVNGVTFADNGGAAAAFDDTGFAGAAGQAGTAGVDADDITFNINVDGAGPVGVTITAAHVAAAGNGDQTVDSLAEYQAVVEAALADAGVTGVTVGPNDAGTALVFTSETLGVDSSVEVTGATANNNNTGTALAIGDTGLDTLTEAAGAADGGDAKTVDELVAEINDANGPYAGFLRASNDNNKLRIENLSTRELNVTPAAGMVGSTIIGGNEVRADLATQYNELRDQLDKLADDASFNGINLLRGDNLRLTFNETGTSSIDIQTRIDGVDGQSINAATLGVRTFMETRDLDADADIETFLSQVKTAINKVKSQSSSFGSNLSIVENRQDFTKNMINTLETGASNLTLADANEEAANMLALQTRQQLSSTALSLASEADQNVLRLF